MAKDWIRIQIGAKSWIRIQIQCIWIHNTGLRTKQIQGKTTLTDLLYVQNNVHLPVYCEYKALFV